MICGIKEKSIILTQTMYCWLLATNIPMRLMTAFVLQGHIFAKLLVSRMSVGGAIILKCQHILNRQSYFDMR